MAAPPVKPNFCCFNLQLRCLLTFWYLLILPTQHVFSIAQLSPQDVLSTVEEKCVVAFPKNEAVPILEIVMRYLTEVTFAEHQGVAFGKISRSGFKWPNGKSLELQDKTLNKKNSDHANANTILIFKKLKKDRSCLLTPNNLLLPVVVSFAVNPSEMEIEGGIEELVLFINTNCGTFQKPEGGLTIAGLHRQDILQNIYHLTHTQPHDSSEQEVCQGRKPDANRSEKDTQCTVGNEDTEESHETRKNMWMQKETDYLSSQHIQQCEKIPMPSSTFEFVNEYVAKSKPVIITGATEKWNAFNKWTNEYLREKFGEEVVHIKLTRDGEYEGVEPKASWEGYDKDQIPKTVLNKLLYPDLVVVRPATRELKFSEFLDLIEGISRGDVKNVSAYLEYSSITDYFPDLRSDISEMQFFKNYLELKHLNIWLSDGNTLGKLHFDPFDNFLCQISGSKQVILYEPHNNTRLYEAHIQEALLTYNESTGTFQRNKLLDSTSMVMSPVDIKRPDLERFPEFANAVPLNCTIGPGEVLFMPSFWWHEVQSKPSPTENRNLAVNFWYEPFLTREFPCPECKLDVNPKYYHLL